MFYRFCTELSVILGGVISGKKMKRSVFLLSLVLLFAGNLGAQNDDLGVWTSVGATKNLFAGLEASVEGEVRTRDDVGAIDRWSGTVGLSYKVCNFLKVGGDYVFIRYNHVRRGWETGHRYNLYATGSYTWKAFTLSLRERYQHTYKRGVPGTDTSANPADIFRSRLQLAYDIKNSAFKPYASMELFHRLNDPQNNGLDKIRYTLGTEYKLNERSTFNVYYRYETVRDDDPNLHILGIGYAIKL